MEKFVKLKIFFHRQVSSTLTLHSRKNKKRQQATVKPIKASDEKTLDNAIAMANMLASKSMHDLDKRHLDDFYDNPSPPVHSPNTPNSPSKKFSFWFPGRVRMAKINKISSS